MSRSPLLSVILSLLVPGLGQIYAGQGERGAAILVAVIIVGNLNAIWFGLWHLSPQVVHPSDMPGGAIAFALMSIPLGLVWGWVAWTTGSIRWTVVAHILLNFAGLAGRSFVPPKANLAKVTRCF